MSSSDDMPPPKPAYDVDWVVSSSSNVHVANHLDWFTSYTPFSTTFNSGIGGIDNGGDICVAGIGDVQLPTKTHPTRSGTAYQSYLILRDVLYAPGILCNIIGSPFLTDYNCLLDYGAGSGKITAKTNGACAALVDLNKLSRLRLRGQSAKQSSLDPASVYIIRANWAPGERAKWKSFRAGHGGQGRGDGIEATHDSPPLMQESRGWFYFLRRFGLSTYKDEDRDEGLRILRALMQESSSEGGDTDSLDSFQRDLEEDPSSHFPDYHFSEEELDWIKANFGHPCNFLRSYGLKFYDDDDCREGKAIFQIMLLEDVPALVH